MAESHMTCQVSLISGIYVPKFLARNPKFGILNSSICLEKAQNSEKYIEIA